MTEKDKVTELKNKIMQELYRLKASSRKPIRPEQLLSLESIDNIEMALGHLYMEKKVNFITSIKGEESINLWWLVGTVKTGTEITRGEDWIIRNKKLYSPSPKNRLNK